MGAKNSIAVGMHGHQTANTLSVRGHLTRGIIAMAMADEQEELDILLEAAACGEEEVVRYCLLTGPWDQSYLDAAMLSAACSGHLPIVLLMAHMGAGDMDLATEGVPPAFCQVCMHDPQTGTKLFAMGAGDPSLYTDNVERPRTWALMLWTFFSRRESISTPHTILISWVVPFGSQQLLSIMNRTTKVFLKRWCLGALT